jgi:hypothetical protein
MTPETISLIAIGISIGSLLVSLHRAASDRALQWEQMRGSLQARLTSRTLEVMALADEIRSSGLERGVIEAAEELERLRREADLRQKGEVRCAVQEMRFIDPERGVIEAAEEVERLRREADLLEKLVDLLQSLTDVRRMIDGLRSPSSVVAYFSLPSLSVIKSDLDDADPVLARLNTAMKQKDHSEASRIVEGLLKRFNGAPNKDANQGASQTAEPKSGAST